MLQARDVGPQLVVYQVMLEVRVPLLYVLDGTPPFSFLWELTESLVRFYLRWSRRHAYIDLFHRLERLAIVSLAGAPAR